MTINLSHLGGDKTHSYTLAKDFLAKSKLSEDYLLPIWCKVRMAKIAPDDHINRYNMVLASILAYNICRKIFII